MIRMRDQLKVYRDDKLKRVLKDCSEEKKVGYKYFKERAINVVYVVTFHSEMNKPYFE